MGQTRTPEQWAAIGLQLGRERGMIDLLANEVKTVETLWMPAGVDPAYVAGVRQGYQEVTAAAGRPLGLGP